MNKHKKFNLILFRIAFVALVLVLLTTHFSAGIAAKFISTASGSDSARVAKFDVDITMPNVQTSQEITLVPSKFEPGSSFEQSFSIKNSSEVAVEYIISVQTTNNLPLTFNFDEQEAKTTPYDLKGTISVGNNSEQTHTLTITWPENEKDYIYSGKIDLITITVTCNQID